MKNISIILIIIAGAAFYITTRPQNHDEARAQLISTLLCKRPNLPQILIDICEGKKAITSLFVMSQTTNGGAAATTPSNGAMGFNKGSFMPSPASPAANPNTYNKGSFMDMSGNIMKIPFPQTYGGPAYSSQMCSNHRIVPCPRDGRECNRKTACGE